MSLPRAVLAAAAMLSCAHHTPAGDPVQLASFDYAWGRVHDTYPDPTFHGLDWDAIGAELRPKAEAARDASELRPVLRDLFSRLGDSHFAVIPGSLAPVVESGGARASVDPGDLILGGGGEVGLDLRLLDGALVVTRVEPGSGAARAGVQTGWILRSIRGRDLSGLLGGLEPSEAARTGRALALARLSGPPGVPVALGLEDGQGQRHELEAMREPSEATWVSLGNLPPMPVHFSADVLAGAVGVIRFDVFMEPVPQLFTPAVQALIAGGVRGVVLDLRGNPGGVAPMAMGMAGHFFPEPTGAPLSLGTLRFRDATLKLLVNPRADRFTGPLAVLVDHLSASTSEIMAAGFQKLGRARIFGEQSAGMALPSTWETLPNGDLIQFVTADFTDPSGARVEGAGVIPDEVVPWSREALLAGHDPALDAATTWLRAAAP